jgi:hypothetical protein
MNTTVPTLPAAGGVLAESQPDRNDAAVHAWQTFLVAVDELTARHAAARQRSYTRQPAAALAALAADLADTHLTPDQVACCAFAWPPATRVSAADLRALAAGCARPSVELP